MKVKVKKLNENAVLPFKAHSTDYCFDVVATSCEEIAPRTYKYGTGLAFEMVTEGEDIEPNTVALSIDLRPRSSVWKTGMLLTNGIGTIDYGYRGEVCAVFYHYDITKPKYEIGDRIGQIVLGISAVMEFDWADELNDTERGAGGYGSTGK